MDKKMLIGMIVLIVGVVLLIIGFTGVLNKSAADLKDDYDAANGNFKSYNKGDTVTVTGKITQEAQELGVYSYELDDSEWGFVASEDIADEGDTVTVNLEVQEMFGIEVMEAKSVQRVPIIGLFGIIIAAVGGVLFLVFFLKSRK